MLRPATFTFPRSAVFRRALVPLTQPTVTTWATQHHRLAAYTQPKVFRSYRFASGQAAKQDGCTQQPPKHFMVGDASHKGAIPFSQVSQIQQKESQAYAELEEASDCDPEARNTMPHPVWSEAAVRSVVRTHYLPKSFSDRLALLTVRTFRGGYDLMSGYALGLQTERNWINRIVFLETVAGVPGLVGATVRHLKSLRRMERDYGWIHTLLEEAENERMHLMTALQVRKPSKFFRFLVFGAQMVIVPLFSVFYITSPQFAHRFVGYLEEEAVKTYTHLIESIEEGKLKNFAKMQAPPMAKQYWELADNALFIDMIYAIRADESHHRDVNHTFASMNPDDVNPFEPGH